MPPKDNVTAIKGRGRACAATSSPPVYLTCTYPLYSPSPCLLPIPLLLLRLHFAAIPPLGSRPRQQHPLIPTLSMPVGQSPPPQCYCPSSYSTTTLSMLLIATTTDTAQVKFELGLASGWISR
mmetsp:Transcript_21756/g.48665  ORF Transcript_21756/g.48665 Transcript_21756/m.48665 type:complete len:123 (-) Transcript_21756:462-830(-)